jgi:hypothetical protein
MASYPLPPPYCKIDSIAPSNQQSNHSRLRISRKPISASQPTSHIQPQTLRDKQIHTRCSTVDSECRESKQSEDIEIYQEDEEGDEEIKEGNEWQEGDDDEQSEQRGQASDRASVNRPWEDKYRLTYPDSEPPLLRVSKPGLSIETSLPPIITTSQKYAGPETERLNAGGSSAASYASASNLSLTEYAQISPSSTLDSSIPTKSPSWSAKKAFQDARHFAGGIISRPIESTKHFTILRHSHGLVFYQGSSTSLAISIFSDAPLPAERTLWLQSKGYSGKRGMKVKALVGRNKDWLDVTPATAVGTEQLNPSDERAWQRDLTKFNKKAPKKIRGKHIARQTAIIRIPANAGDGYFAIVMCMGDNKRKVLCTSPTFRLLSASTVPSSVRGASLSTLPLELGAMLFTTYAKNTAVAAAAPAAAVVQASVGKYMPSFWTQRAVTTAYSATEGVVTSTFEQANTRYEEVRIESAQTIGMTEVALEEGPKPPYPIPFVGRALIGESNMVEELGMPVFTITGIAEATMARLHGYYFGWVRKSDEATNNEPWSEAIVSVMAVDLSQLARVSLAQANKKTVTVRLINDFGEEPSDGVSFEVRVLGFIRPDEPTQRRLLEKGIEAGDEAAHEAAMICEANDIETAQRMLDHPAWSADAISRPGLTERKSSGIQKLSKGIANTRLAAQQQIDRVPVHKLGVRTDSHVVKDRAVVTNGFYVVR